MAASFLPKPGSPHGPCRPTRKVPMCSHVDCAATRSIADSECHYCPHVIGYDTAFYDVTPDAPVGVKVYAHATCHAEAIERKNKEYAATAANTVAARARDIREVLLRLPGADEEVPVKGAVVVDFECDDGTCKVTITRASKSRQRARTPRAKRS